MRTSESKRRAGDEVVMTTGQRQRDRETEKERQKGRETEIHESKRQIDKIAR